jgi:GntR family transcriptional regulator, uxu operon transcriptional repressor
MQSAAPAGEAEPARRGGAAGPAAGTGSAAAAQASPGAGAMHAERGQRLAELILSESRRAGHGPGSRLPTERQLAADLGVTRSSVRHALAMLEDQGRISREVGRGTFLRDRPGPVADARGPAPAADGAGTPTPAAAPGADFAPADVMTVRRLLEPPAMSLVVAWATAADLDEMDRCLAGGDAAASYEEFESWDLALHRCIMAASHSPLLAALYQAIEAARHGQVWGDLKRRSASSENRRQYQGDHRAIVGALRARDSAGAVEAMRLHLARVSDHLNATDPAAAVTWR